MPVDDRLPPGPRLHFSWGNAWEYQRDPLAFVMRVAREYGDMVRLRMPGMTAYLVSHPEQIESVLRTNHRLFMKDKITRALSSLLGQGLITSEGEFWRRQRRLAQPAFMQGQVERYASIVTDTTERLVSSWRPGERRNVPEDMMRLTLEIIAQVLLGQDVADEAATVGECLADVMAYFATPAVNWSLLPDWLPTPAGVRYRRAVKRLDAILFAAIRRGRAAGGQRDDLLSRLLAATDDEGRPMNERELRDELMTLFLAGHETTSLALTYAFHLLSEHPEIEQRLVAHLDEVLAGRVPTAADVGRLKYVEWVVCESMRLYPPVWAIAREALVDCEIGGYRVPRGTQLWFAQWVVHRDPRWFAEPDKFQPERWDGDFARTLPRCAYFPFGDGPRVCLGNHFAMTEAILVLATVLSRYRLAPTAPMNTASSAKLELFASITLRPRHKLELVVRQPTAVVAR